MDPSERTRVFETEISPLLDTLYTMALRLTGNTVSAEDLVQDTAVKVYKNLERFEGGTRLRAWIHRIMVNTHINNYRKVKRTPHPVDISRFEPEGGEEVPAFFTLEDIERIREHIGDGPAEALDKLPMDFRAVFLLSAFGELSYKEIAETLEVPIGTVMSRLSRARDSLRRSLRDSAREAGLEPERSATPP